MTLRYIGHPFSSYSWKGEIALLEKGLDYSFLSLDPGHAANPDAATADSPGGLLTRHSPSGKFPLLLDGDTVVFESSLIIEYLDHHHPYTPRLIPTDFEASFRVRMFDRMFDNHVMTPMQAVVAEHIPFITETPDPARIARAKDALSAIYPWLDRQLPEDGWACGEDFTLADCSGAPALFYADWVQRIPAELTRLTAYRQRLLARPSVAHCVEAARPFRHNFPLGAPDRD